MRKIKFESFTSVDPGRMTLDLPYLEDQRFHIERILDFITPTIPLFSIHQARTTLLFLYCISVGVIYCFIPQMKNGSTVISVFTLSFPLICVTAFHIILSLLYIIFALFAGACFRTLVGIHFYLHTNYAIAIFSLMMVHFSNDISNPVFMYLVGCAASAFLDFILGLYASSNHRTFLLLDLVFIFPTLLIWSLFEKNIVPSKFYIFIPSIVFYLIYFNLLIGLAKCMPKCFHKLSAKFFSDSSLYAEYEASENFQSYWNSALWREEPIRLHIKETSSSSSSSEFENNIDAPLFTSGTKKKDFRFPRKEKFQLYKLDDISKHPFYICSLISSLVLAGNIVLVLIHCYNPIPGFLIIFGCTLILLIFSIIFNSRAIAWNCFAITNIGNDIIHILWDHPSLSMI